MKRIQRKRQKGFRLPENTVCVDRSTKWGNPFKLLGDIIYIDAGYRRKTLDKWVYFNHGDKHDIVYLFEKVLTGAEFQNEDAQYWSGYFSKLDLTELKGKNLACFCNLGEPCHASVLIRKANRFD